MSFNLNLNVYFDRRELAVAQCYRYHNINYQIVIKLATILVFRLQQQPNAQTILQMAARFAAYTTPT